MGLRHGRQPAEVADRADAEGLAAPGRGHLRRELGRRGPGRQRTKLVTVEGEPRLRRLHEDVLAPIVIEVAVHPQGGEVAGRWHRPGRIRHPVPGAIAQKDASGGRGVAHDVQVAIAVDVAGLDHGVRARDREAARGIGPSSRRSHIAIAAHPEGAQAEDQVIAPVAIGVARIDTVDRPRRKAARGRCETKRSIAEKSVRPRSCTDDVRVTVGVEVARLGGVSDGPSGQRPGRAPRPVAVVRVDAQAVAPAKGLGEDVEPAIGVEVGQGRGEHAP